MWFGQSTQQVVKRAAVFFAALLGFTLLGQTHANDRYYSNIGDDNFKSFNKQKVYITPTRMMDSETLLHSARIERESSMSATKRLLHCQWLASHGRKTYLGAAAVRKFLRMSVKSYLKTNSNNDQPRFSLTEAEEDEMIALSDLDNYNLKLSDDKILLGFKYKF